MSLSTPRKSFTWGNPFYNLDDVLAGHDSRSSGWAVPMAMILASCREGIPDNVHEEISLAKKMPIVDRRLDVAVRRTRR